MEELERKLKENELLIAKLKCQVTELNTQLEVMIKTVEYLERLYDTLLNTIPDRTDSY